MPSDPETEPRLDSTVDSPQEVAGPLLGAARRGDHQAMSTLLRSAEHALMVRFAGQIPRELQSVLSVEDIVLETFAEAFHDFRRFRGNDQASFCAWLAKIAERNLRDAMRELRAQKRGGGSARVQFTSRADSEHRLDEQLAASQTSACTQAVRDEWGTRLRAAVNGLPAAHREVVERYDLQGQPMEEVAAALGIRPGAAWMRRQRALELLRELLGSTSRFL